MIQTPIRIEYSSIFNKTLPLFFSSYYSGCKLQCYIPCR